MATTYTAPEYDDKKYKTGIDTSAYDKQTEMFKQQAETNRANQLGDAQKVQQSALKQAYVQRLQNQQKLNQSLATSGIRGGATETSNLNLMNQYGQARASANANYSNTVNEVNRNVDQSIADATMDIESRKQQYLQDQANARWQADREDSLNQYNSQLEYWNNYYNDVYSGYSKSNAKKEVKNLEKQLANATTDDEKRRLMMAIRGARARLGVIANK